MQIVEWTRKVAALCLPFPIFDEVIITDKWVIVFLSNQCLIGIGFVEFSETLEKSGEASMKILLTATD